MKFRTPLLVMGLFSMSLLSSCSNRNNDFLKTKLKHMETLQIKVPFSDMVRMKNLNVVENEFAYDSADMKLIVYSDSSECNLCAIKKMYDWNDYIKMSSALHGKIVFRFIVTAPKGMLEEIKKAYFFSNVQSPIYIDTTGVFLKNNPSLPSERIFHTFLLDKNDHVILVGNPLSNPNIEELFMNIIEESNRHNSSG